MATVSTNYLRTYVETAIALGAPAARLHTLLPGGRRALDDPDLRLPADVLIDVLDAAARLTGNDAIGLRVGMQFRPADFMDIGYAIAAAGTISEALDINCRYQPLTQDIVRLKVETIGRRTRLVCDSMIPEPARMRRVIEAIIAGYTMIGRWLLYDQDQPARLVTFRHNEPEPETCEIYRELFGAAVRFGAEADMLEFDAALMNRPLANANPAQVALLRRRLDERLAAMQSGETLKFRVMNTISSQLRTGRPSLPKTAHLLGLSERTLRRRLDDLGLRFSDLLQAARREACEAYLREPGFSHAEIAQLIGYSDQSAYSRAFRSWFGMTPQAYRDRLASHAARG